jgi:uncharacterized membrane protein
MAIAAAHPSSVDSFTSARVRLPSIDMLRGLVMMLMALDHVRDFFSNARFDPLDLSHTTTPLFLTRWITHFCAPAFIFLAGVSARLMASRYTRAQLSRFLATRGFWLVILEVTVVTFVWTFGLDYSSGVYLQVIWAIGVSMLVLSLLVYLPVRVIAVLSIAVIFGHDLTDHVAPASFGAWAPLWSVLHVPGPTAHAYIDYPLIPWIAVMSLGYSAGVVFQLEPLRRRRILVLTGAAALALFLLFRIPNIYGDPAEWAIQSTDVRTLLSLINVQKYPPSLDYLLITLGAACLLLAAFESARGRWSAILLTFGRVPLFFYVVHIGLAHLVAGIVGYGIGLGARILLLKDFTTPPVGWGFDLPIVYAVWCAILLALYPVCRWFAEVKRHRSDWWLSYL